MIKLIRAKAAACTTARVKVTMIKLIRAKAAACTTAAEARAFYDAAPSHSDAAPIYLHRWVELVNAEAAARAAACTTAAEARALCDEGAPYGSDAMEIYDARWMELHLAAG